MLSSFILLLSPAWYVFLQSYCSCHYFPVSVIYCYVIINPKLRDKSNKTLLLLSLMALGVVWTKLGILSLGFSCSWRQTAAGVEAVSKASFSTSLVRELGRLKDLGDESAGSPQASPSFSSSLSMQSPQHGSFSATRFLTWQFWVTKEKARLRL